MRNVFNTPFFYCCSVTLQTCLIQPGQDGRQTLGESVADLIVVGGYHPGTADQVIIIIMTWSVGIAEGTSRTCQLASTYCNKVLQ